VYHVLFISSEVLWLHSRVKHSCLLYSVLNNISAHIPKYINTEFFLGTQEKRKEVPAWSETSYGFWISLQFSRLLCSGPVLRISVLLANRQRTLRQLPCSLAYFFVLFANASELEQMSGSQSLSDRGSHSFLECSSLSCQLEVCTGPTLSSDVTQAELLLVRSVYVLLLLSYH
jgi:hypothetical protein